MSLTLRLIGYISHEGDNKYMYEIKMLNIRIISFEIIKTYFSSFGIDEEQFNFITLSCDAQDIKKKKYKFKFNIRRKKIMDIYI